MQSVIEEKLGQPALIAVMLAPMMGGRSPHMVIRPEQIELGLTDVRGLDTQVDEVVRTLDVFLGYATFRDELGGNPRRGILFEGPPGTGKTYLAKAMAKQAGVPFLFISSPSFTSMWQGASALRVSLLPSSFCPSCAMSGYYICGFHDVRVRAGLLDFVHCLFFYRRLNQRCSMIC